jgi:flagellar protein FliJ
MASSSALIMLLNLASEEAELASKNLAIANQAFKAEQEKVEMLQRYKQDYIDHHKTQMSKGVGKEAHLNFQSFLQNLQQAIDGQDKLLVSAEYEREKMRAALIEAQRKKISYEVLIKRAEKKAVKLAVKKDQKMMDEFAMRTKRTHT